MMAKFCETLAFLFGAAFLEGQLVAAPQSGDRELVLKEVLSPLPNSNFDRSWDWALPMGDADRDGNGDFFLSYALQDSAPPNQIYYPGVFGLNPAAFMVGPNGLAGGRIQYHSGWTNVYTCLLRTPSGLHLLARDNWFGALMGSWDAKSGRFIRHYGIPSPPSGRPPMLGFNHIQWGGDVNRDGYDDFYVQSYTGTNPDWAVTVLLDGKTGDPVWQSYEEGFGSFTPLLYQESPKGFDINGDGVDDFLSAFSTIVFFQKDLTINALSGADGTLIWQVKLPLFQGYPRYAVFGRDLDGDGLKDLVSFDSPRGTYNGNVTAISGMNGSMLWSVDGSFLASNVPPGAAASLVYPGLMTDRPGQPGKVDVLVSAEVKPLSGEDYFAYAVLDGLTGAYQEMLQGPPDLNPWLPDSTTNILYEPRHFPIGDIDGDGFQEIAQSLAVPNYKNPGTAIIPRVLAILGQKTLDVPNFGTLGSTINAKVDLPSLPSHQAHLVLSTRMAQRQLDWTVQGWGTGLLDSVLLQASLQRSALSMQLNANGFAEISIGIPNRPEFSGLAIYTRALVFKPGTRQLKTMSTLGITHIQ